MRIAARRRAKGERGFALLIVLWSLVLITLLITQVTSAGRSEANLAGNLRRAAALRAETDGALHAAIFHLLDPASGWRADGTEHRVKTQDGTVMLRITDELGKINPNLASPAMLAAMLRAAGLGEDEAGRLGAAILQWRYPSGEPPTTGEKAQTYRAAGRSYAPPSANFESVNELGLVLGMSPGLVARLAPHLTLYTDDQPDPRLADPLVAQVLESMGITAPAGPVPPPRVVTIMAAASGAGSTRFTRRAVVSLGPDSAGRQFRIVTWEAPAL